MSTPSNRRRKSLAQTTVEFALVCPIFFALLFATLDYAQLFFYDHSLRYALYMSGRFAMTRKPMVYYTNGVPSKIPVKVGGTNISHYKSMRWVFQSNCVMFVPEKDIRAYWYTMEDKTLKPGPGDKETFLRLNASYKVTLITPYGALLNAQTNQAPNQLIISATGTFRLENAETAGMPIKAASDPL